MTFVGVLLGRGMMGPARERIGEAWSQCLATKRVLPTRASSLKVRLQRLRANSLPVFP